MLSVPGPRCRALHGQQQEPAARDIAALGLKAWDKADADLPQLATRATTIGAQK